MQDCSPIRRAPARRPHHLAALLSGALLALGLGGCGGSGSTGEPLVAPSQTSYTHVSTYAGSGAYGTNDSPGTAARATFNTPLGVAVDRYGHVYVADTFNHMIRKIAATGQVSTLAGSGVAGASDGAGTAASFNEPRGIAVGYDGTVYVAEFGNHLIRKISPQGVVSTLAGSGRPGDADGMGSAAAFRVPEGLVVVGDGSVYVADTFNHKIRRIAPNGQVSTLAGSGRPGSADGTGSMASFNAPVGIAFHDGVLVIGDSGNHMVRRIDVASGLVTTLAGSTTSGSADGVGAAASFYHPEGVAIDTAGDVHVADFDNHRVRKISANGTVSTVAGTGSVGSADGNGTNASMRGPFGVAVDHSGNVYVADAYNHAIRKLTPVHVVSTVAGTGSSGALDGAGAAPAAFLGPVSLALDALGTLYVGDRKSVRKVGIDGHVTTLAGDSAYPNLYVESPLDGAGSDASFGAIGGVAVGVDGTLYVLDHGANTLRKVSPGGVVSTLAGSGSAGSADGSGAVASFSSAIGLVMDRQGTLYVADSANHRIRKVTPDGRVSTLAGTGQPGAADGRAAAATFNRPFHLAIDTTGALYVYDAGSYSVRKISTAGMVSTLAGGTEGMPSDGKGAAAVFDSVGGMAVGPDGALYVSDFHTVRRVSADGTVTTLAGSATQGGTADGDLSAARFNGLGGIAIAPDGRIFVADYGSHTIRVLHAAEVTTLPAPPQCLRAGCTGEVPATRPAKDTP